MLTFLEKAVFGPQGGGVWLGGSDKCLKMVLKIKNGGKRRAPARFSYVLVFVWFLEDENKMK